jgi:hypothetical protein
VNKLFHRLVLYLFIAKSQCKANDGSPKRGIAHGQAAKAGLLFCSGHKLTAARPAIPPSPDWA